MLLFCVASSATYIFNDLVDAERDGAHPRKKMRPLASGMLRPRHVKAALAGLLGVVAAAAAAWPAVGLVLVLYHSINAAYTVRLKHVPLVDLFCIATGFVLRVWAGALALDVPLSDGC